MAKFRLPNLKLGSAGRIFKKIAQLMKVLNPVPNVGGLEISETALRFFAFQNGGILTKSLRLPPGVIQFGRVSDAKTFSDALKNIRAQAGPPGKPIHVVVLLPPAAVYTEAFRLPDLSEEKLAEAAQLNMQMLSPTDANATYMGTEKIGGSSEGEQIDLLGAFAEKTIVDGVLSALEEANFIVAAVEFPALSIARLISKLSDAASAEPYLAIQIMGDGLMVMILKNNKLYFSRFISWMSMREELGKQALSEEDLGQVISREVQQVVNFYSSRWGHALQDAVIVADQLNDQIGKILTAMFLLKVRQVAIREFPTLPIIWWPALGAALRGFVPRAEDTAVSLTPATVRMRYWNDRVHLFVNLWQKILVVSFGFIFLVFVGFNLFLLGREHNAEEIAQQTAISPEDKAQVDELQRKATEFNALVDRVFAAGTEIVRWAPFLERLEGIASGLVELTRISLDGQKVSIAGEAGVGVAVIQFKDKLVAEKNFQNVVLPIANIKADSRGGVTFTLTFDLVSLPTLFENSTTATP